MTTVCLTIFHNDQSHQFIFEEGFRTCFTLLSSALVDLEYEFQVEFVESESCMYENAMDRTAAKERAQILRRLETVSGFKIAIELFIHG